MNYRDFVDSGFTAAFDGKAGVYVISIPNSNAHTVYQEEARNTRSKNNKLVKGDQLFKIGVSGTPRSERGIPGRFASYGTAFPNGFMIHMILIKNGKDLINSENKIHKWLADIGLIYNRYGDLDAGASQTEWGGVSLPVLQKELLKNHRASRSRVGAAWWFEDGEGYEFSDPDLALADRLTLTERCKKGFKHPRKMNQDTAAYKTRSSRGLRSKLV